ncbi:CPBP family glutamic-type intramembrane protease [Thetidibacter halocola]|uniref:CPBP family intramembrane metalloprotease n=1 Tax=Thetidibacter halocola TaxID=2827239 RepID=A0A8J7WDD7_9RHOB|nr:CPBP family intramembrane metalloprotease [Thetidibacter halocola]
MLIGVLYGGLTEEVMLRWGLMSLLAVWMLCLMSSARAIWSATLIAALAFAATHLPAVMHRGRRSQKRPSRSRSARWLRERGRRTAVSSIRRCASWALSMV